MSCVPKALSYLINGNEYNDWKYETLLEKIFGRSEDGWSDMQMVVVAAMFGVYLTPFAEAVDPVSFFSHYFGSDGILVGKKENGEPHAHAKLRNPVPHVCYNSNEPSTHRLFYAVSRTCGQSVCKAVGEASR